MKISIITATYNSAATLDDTLGVALKVHEDVLRVRERGVLEGV